MRGGEVYVLEDLREINHVRWMTGSRRITRRCTSFLFFCWHAATIVSICFRKEVASSFCCNSLSASSRTRYLAVFSGSCLSLSNRHSLRGVAISRSTCTSLCSSSHCACNFPCQLFPLFRSQLLCHCKFQVYTTVDNRENITVSDGQSLISFYFWLGPLTSIKSSVMSSAQECESLCVH